MAKKGESDIGGGGGILNNLVDPSEGTVALVDALTNRLFTEMLEKLNYTDIDNYMRITGITKIALIEDLNSLSSVLDPQSLESLVKKIQG